MAEPGNGSRPLAVREEVGPVALAQLREEVFALVRGLPVPPAALSVRAGDCVVELTWAPAGAAPAGAAPAAGPVPAATPPAAEPEPAPGLVVPAPMVGTFYRRPRPDAPPYVEVGDRVEAGQPIGLVEAMKLMNPIETEHAGVVAEILVADGRGVEYGQPLVRIVPTP